MSAVCTCPVNAAILNVVAVDCPTHFRRGFSTSWSDATPTAAPATLNVPLVCDEWTEPRLMAALEFVVRAGADAHPQDGAFAIARAVDWLHSKYGSPYLSRYLGESRPYPEQSP